MQALASSVAALTSFLLFLAVHWLLWKKRELQKVTFLGYIAGFSYVAVTLGILAFVRIDLLLYFSISLPLFAFLVIAYVRFYITIVRTLSIRILQELWETPTESLTLTELESRYPKNWMLASRLRLLTKNGWLRARHGMYVCNPKGTCVARSIIALRRFYGFQNAG
jgi:hypothetical protein